LSSCEKCVLNALVERLTVVLYVWLYRREQMQKEVEELKGKLAVTTQESLSAEERSKLMESAMQAEEKRQEVLHGEIAQLSAIKFKRGNELHAMKQQKRIMDTEMQVTMALH